MSTTRGTEINPQITQIIEKDPRTFAIIGAAFEVHRQLGSAFLEAVYQEAFQLELAERSIPFKREIDLPIEYKGRLLSTGYRADFICYDSVIVELKAVSQFGGVEEAQVINYLKATGYGVGLLINFGAKSLQHRRFALTHSKSSKSA
ncbi:MAG: GxxExxY protein [SAR202 cluster bacterium]|nr:GxxExxY protein [SAR202 cluster bacterium]